MSPGSARNGLSRASSGDEADSRPPRCFAYTAALGPCPARYKKHFSLARHLGLLAPIASQFNHVILEDVTIDAKHRAAFHPTIDVGTKPGLYRSLRFTTTIVQVLDRKFGFDDEGVELAGLGGDLLLAGYPGLAD